MDRILSFSQLAATNINTQMTPQEHAEIKALKDCIRWLINAGNSMSAWYNTDHPKYIHWREAVGKASLFVPSVEQSQSNDQSHP